MLDSKDISVVVQGAIDKENTPKCIESIRKYLPNAEIILSTWIESEVEGLDFDELVLSEDPGGVICSSEGKVSNNCNRQIVSSFSGIQKCTKKYVLKIRSDLIINGRKLLDLKQKKYNRKPQYSCFKERILVCSIYSRHYAIRHNTDIKTPVLFHPSDWFYFGLREDLLSLFDIPLTDEPNFSQWFKDKPHERNGWLDSHPDRLWRFSPEAYIFTTYLRKNFNINIQDKLDITDKNIMLSRNLLVNNFYMVDQPQISLQIPKYKIYQPLMPIVDALGLYSNYHWHKEYKYLINRKHYVPLTYCEILNKIVKFFGIKRRKR